MWVYLPGFEMVSAPGGKDTFLRNVLQSPSAQEGGFAARGRDLFEAGDVPPVQGGTSPASKRSRPRAANPPSCALGDWSTFRKKVSLPPGAETISKPGR